MIIKSKNNLGKFIEQKSLKLIKLIIILIIIVTNNK